MMRKEICSKWASVENINFTAHSSEESVAFRFIILWNIFSATANLSQIRTAISHAEYEIREKKNTLDVV